MTPAHRLRAALQAVRWSYATLASECGVSPATVRRWASGGRYPVPPDVLRALERFAGAKPVLGRVEKCDPPENNC